MPSGGLSLDVVAERLHVHYMTVYRYVRQGRLVAERVKGVWQVSEEALAQFQQERSRQKAAAPSADPSIDPRRTGNYIVELERCLTVADAAGAWAVLERAIAAGADVDEVYLNILSPALASIGERWAAGHLNIAVEHQATAIATRLVGQLSPRFLRRGRHRGMVVIGGPTGERHALTLAMLGDLLRREGWEVLDLGPDTPEESFVHAVSSLPDTVAVGVSVASDESLTSASRTIRTLRETFGDDIPVVVGGQAIRDHDQAQSLGAEYYADGARGFLDLLDQITGKTPVQRQAERN